MSIELRFRIKLLSDYHLGAGHGLGRVLDSALQRDADGVPVLRGTTISGLLRNALHELATTTALQASLTWQKFRARPEFAAHPASGRGAKQGDALFGAPWLAKRWRISSARPLGLEIPQATSQKHWRTGGLGAHPAPHVRVDPATRRAEDRKLFVREEGTQNLEFVFTIECQEASSDMRVEAALFVAAARMVRYVGANRRRGRGRCIIRLESVQNWPVNSGESIPNQDELLKQFESYWLKGEPQILTATEPTVTATTSSGQPVRLLLIARADEPILIARRAEAGNQFESLAYIPGFALRGAFAGRIRTTYDLDSSDSAVYPTFTHLFFRGGMSWASLYPGFVPSKSSRIVPTIPIPQDLFVSEQHPQEDQLGISDWQIYLPQDAAALDFKEQVGAQSLKLEPVDGYVALDKSLPLVRPGRSNEMHVTISEETGRAQDAQLFGYTVLEAGQYFLGELLFADEADWESLRHLAQLPTVPALTDQDKVGEPSDRFTLSIGKGRLRGYGTLSTVLLRMGNDMPTLAAGATLVERVTSVTDPLCMMLVSDAIVLDPWGRAYQHFADDWLSDVLGFQVHVATTEGKSGTTHPLQFASTRTIDGFNAYLGLPRQRDIALSAGSAVTLKIDDPIDLATLQRRLAQIEHDGIGVRRHEGFGRICFNHPIYRDDHVLKPPYVQLPTALILGNGTPDTAQGREQMFVDRWRGDLDDADWKIFKRSDPADLFDGVVREIHSLAAAKPQQVEACFRGYGTPTQLLPEGWSERQKTNRFDEEGRQGMDMIRNLLVDLNTQYRDNPEFWARGCRMLANRLAQELPKRKGAKR